MGVPLFVLIICLTHIEKIITTKNGLRILDKKNTRFKRESYIPENWSSTQNTDIMKSKCRANLKSIYSAYFPIKYF